MEKQPRLLITDEFSNPVPDVSCITEIIQKDDEFYSIGYRHMTGTGREKDLFLPVAAKY